MKIDLVYDPDCPNVEPTRERLRAILGELSLPSHWDEWDRTDPDTPAHLLGFGSPTVLVDGRDVSGTTTPMSGSCCRLYAATSGATSGVPPLEDMRFALMGSIG